MGNIMPASQAKILYEALRNHLLQAEERAVFRALPHQIAWHLNAAPRLVLEKLVEAMFQGDAILHYK
jgi:hypothetical protein